MRDRIKDVATELLVLHGYRGFRFGHIAERLNRTRANIHYHFRTKEQLVEEVVCDYVAGTEEQFRDIWLNEKASLNEKIRQTMGYNHQRYIHYNPAGNTGHPWSLIARMRSDQDLLTAKAREALQNFGPAIESHVRAAIILAKKKDELKADAPVDDLALQIVSIANSAGPITQDAGSFSRLEELYLAFARIVNHAYGINPDANDPVRTLKLNND